MKVEDIKSMGALKLSTIDSFKNPKMIKKLIILPIMKTIIAIVIIVIAYIVALLFKNSLAEE